MQATISLEGKQQLFEQLFYELKFALKDLSSRELGEIFLEASGKSIKATWNSKVQSMLNLKKFSKQFISFGKNTAERYKNNGFKTSIQEDYKKVEELTFSIPSKIRTVYDNFLSLPRDKQIELVTSAILVTSIYLACCGGLDAEGGLPDMDITIAGIGHHRSIISHSIILGLGVEFTGRLMILVLSNIKGRLPEPHLAIWDHTFSFIEKNKDKAIAAMWLGIGIHLIKDSGLLLGGMKPYTDAPFHMSQAGHNATFAINGMASSAFANSSN